MEVDRDEEMESMVKRYQRTFSVGRYNSSNSSKVRMSYYFYLGGSLPYLPLLETNPSFYSGLLPLYAYLSDPPHTWQPNDPSKRLQQSLTTTDYPSPAQISSSSLPGLPCASVIQTKAEKSIEKERLSAKKNSESNIINQFYSFFSNREKSERLIMRCSLRMGKDSSAAEKLVAAFYVIVRYINARRGRKYVNLAMFLQFFEPEELQRYMGEMGGRISQMEGVQLTEVCQIFRRCARYFFKVMSPAALLTSKRISINSKSQHLKKLRKIIKAVHVQ